MNILNNLSPDAHYVITSLDEERQKELLSNLNNRSSNLGKKEEMIKVIEINIKKIMVELQEIKSILKDPTQLEIIYREYITISILLQLLNTDVNLNEEQLIYLKQLQIIKNDIINGSLNEYLSNMGLITSVDNLLADISKEEQCVFLIGILNGQVIDDNLFQKEINHHLFYRTPFKFIFMTSDKDLLHGYVGNSNYLSYENDYRIIDARNKIYQIN